MDESLKQKLMDAAEAIGATHVYEMENRVRHFVLVFPPSASAVAKFDLLAARLPGDVGWVGGGSILLPESELGEGESRVNTTLEIDYC